MKLCAACRSSPVSRKGLLCCVHWRMLLKPIREHLERDSSVLAGALCYIRRKGSELPAEWRPVVGFKGCQVSSLGQVRRENGKLAPWDVNSSLYPMVTLAPGNRRLVHCLVAEAFLGPRPDGHLIDHEDENTLNPAAGNLSYVTRSRNSKKRKKSRKLGAMERAKIRKRARTESIHVLAAEFGVSTVAVRQIAREPLAAKPGTLEKRRACS